MSQSEHWKSWLATFGWNIMSLNHEGVQEGELWDLV